MRSNRSEYPVTGDTNMFGFYAWQLTKVDGWARPTLMDLSAANIMVNALEREVDGHRGKDVALATLVKELLLRKVEVSLRIRTFRGRIGRAVNVGRHAWQLMEELVAQAESVTDVEKRFLACWRSVAKDTYELGEGEAVLDKFVEWTEAGTLDNVRESASMVPDLHKDQQRQCRRCVVERRKSL